ncbi:hypothetical protein LOD99_2149 [Oopsacas minuta]|uniref:Uncharacterized protein n=1 Tax=Oopsacas minuta TaxID=111878 RepID=A0AAV7K3M1_9METZ|nr:hypothetical protein LOD99_2149 [Oopsacas minuta]
MDGAFCIACSLFGNNSRASFAETSWSHDGVNRWDKMKSRGKGKKEKLFEHFSSSSHRLAAERLRSSKLESTHVDVVISSARKKKFSQEEQEPLQNRKL